MWNYQVATWHWHTSAMIESTIHFPYILVLQTSCWNVAKLLISTSTWTGSNLFCQEIIFVFCACNHLPMNVKTANCLIALKIIMAFISMPRTAFAFHFEFYKGQGWEKSEPSFTVGKYHDFSIIEILREINFGESRSTKTIRFCHFWVTRFYQFC